MTLRDFGLLTDENIHPAVVRYLRAEGFEVLDVREAGLAGTQDRVLIQRARAENRVIVTQDSDFGTLALATGERCPGILYLRPGHILPDFTITTIRTILAQEISVQPPFILVGVRSGTSVRIRVRAL